MPMLEYFAAGFVALCSPNPGFGLFPEDGFVPRQYCVVQVCATQYNQWVTRHEVIGDSLVLFKRVSCHNV